MILIVCPQPEMEHCTPDGTHTAYDVTAHQSLKQATLTLVINHSSNGQQHST